MAMHPVGASHACSACLPRATGSRFGMNSGATQRAVELQLAAADPTRPTVRGLAVESGAPLGERRRPKQLPRRAAFEHVEPERAAASAALPAGCQALAGRPGVLHGPGRQATLRKMKTQAQHPSAPTATPRFLTP